jgi:hypothetical protein
MYRTTIHGFTVELFFNSITFFINFIVNAGSNKQRDDSNTETRLIIDRKEDVIEIYNNGKGLLISNHPVENKPIPSIMFGQFITSNNFNDNLGFCAKLCNLFSTKFTVRINDKKMRTAYLSKHDETICKSKKKSFLANLSLTILPMFLSSLIIQIWIEKSIVSLSSMTNNQLIEWFSSYNEYRVQFECKNKQDELAIMTALSSK